MITLLKVSMGKVLLVSIGVSLFSCTGNHQTEEDFLYKIGVKINAGNVEFNDKVIELEINFEDKLKECYSQGKRVDYGSLKVQEVDSLGNFLDDCISQLDIKTLVWIMKGITPKQSARYYNICFNSTDRKGAEIIFNSGPVITKENLPGRWAFTTPGGYFVFEEKGGAFEIFSPRKCEDNSPGNDWIRDDYKEYNGILNIGDPDTKAIFHPNEDIEVVQGQWGGCKSDIVTEGPLKYRIRSINKFGELSNDYRSNTSYTIYFDVFPNFIRASVTQGNEKGYASVMELTPGGDSLEVTDYVVRSNGQKYMKGERYAEDISDEWAFIGDAQDPNCLFFVHAQDDSVKDGLNWYEFMQAVMVGWGRGANPAINDYPNEFYFGFAKNSGYPEMKKFVSSLTSTPQITIGNTQKSKQADWGKVNIEKVDNNLRVSMENNKIRFAYTPVMTANLESAITDLTLKDKNINVAGKHLDEMAKGGSDRGVLSDKTTIIYEGSDKKIVHLEWDNGRSIEEITLFKDKPYLKIDYLKMYLNICDLGNKEVFEDGKYSIFGADPWRDIRKRKLDAGFQVDSNAHHALTDALYPGYPNPLIGNWKIAAEDNPMNYKGWYILGIYSPGKSVAYGRVVPAKVVDHLKLLGNTGFEQFPYWFDKQTRKPFTEYLFVIQGGKDEIISMGKEIVEFANKASWSIIDSTNLTISNNLIEVGYGPDKMVEQNRLSGLSFFKYKPSGLNLAEVLDAYGYGYARYYSGGPSRYEVSHIDSNYLEVTISVRSQNGNRVVVQKQERIFRNLAVLEIEYSKLDLLWWEDFYSTEREEKRVYTIYGVNKEITQQMHKAFRKKAEEDCGHNFGDCYLRAAGSDTLKSMYKGFVIFGFYDTITNTGLGFVLPASMGLHNGFKLWSMHNYESFPFYHMQQKLPLRRWIFATEKGREGILSMGKAIADLQSKNKSIFSNIESLENF